jgi:hypothetical protein
MSLLVPFGSSPLAALWQGLYSTTNPLAVGDLVTNSVYNCGVTYAPGLGGSSVLTMTLEQPSVNAHGAPTGIDDAAYIPFVKQYGRQPVSISTVVIGGAVPDTTNTIVLTFDVAFVTDANLVSLTVFQSVPPIDADGNYVGGGNP